MVKNVTCFLATVLSLLLTGCVGGPGLFNSTHATMTYYNVKSVISRNNKNLMNLKIGMTQEQVLQQMGKPERSEGYLWGSAWLYRTAMTSGIYGTADSDFTPVVFDEKGTLIGWGRNFFIEQVKRYEVKVIQNSESR